MPLLPRHFPRHFMQQQSWLSCANANGAVACCSHSRPSTSTSGKQIQFKSHHLLRHFHQTVAALNTSSSSSTANRPPPPQNSIFDGPKLEGNSIRLRPKRLQTPIKKSPTKTLDSRVIRFGPDLMLCAKLQEREEGKHGKSQKFIDIFMIHFPGPICCTFPQIPLPDAYKLVHSLDWLKVKLPFYEPPEPDDDLEEDVVLISQRVEGDTLYDYELAIVWHHSQWALRMCNSPISSSNSNKRMLAELAQKQQRHVKEPTGRTMFLPLLALTWLRRQMVEMLANSCGDCTEHEQQIGKSVRMPGWTREKSQDNCTSKSENHQDKIATAKAQQQREQIEQFLLVDQGLMFATEHEQMALHELATKSLCLPNGQKLVHLVLIEAMDGNSKYLRISNLLGKTFSPIPVPVDAYIIVDAIDQLIGRLPAQKPPRLWPEKEAGSVGILDSQLQTDGTTVHDYLLAIACNLGKLELHMHSLWKPENKDPHWPKERTIFLPFWAAPWLRQQMAEMLAKDGEENVEGRIGQMPAVPEWVEQLRTNRTTTQIDTNT